MVTLIEPLGIKRGKLPVKYLAVPLITGNLQQIVNLWRIRSLIESIIGVLGSLLLLDRYN